MLKKLLFVFGSLTIIILLLLSYLVFGTFDSETLGNLAISEVSQATGMELLTAERFSLSLLHGLTLEGVTAKGKSPYGEIDLTLRKMLFEHKLSPLLSGTLLVERLHLDGLEAEIIIPKSKGSTKDESEIADSPEQTGSGFRLEVREIRIIDSDLILIQKDGSGDLVQSVKIQGINLDLADVVYDPEMPRPIQSISGQGNLDIAEVLIETHKIHEIQGQFRMSQGLVNLDGLKLRTDYGPLEAKMSIDMNPVPFTYSLETKGGPVDVNRMLKADSGFGNATLNLTGNGIGPDPKAFNGVGTLQIDAGNLPEHRMLQLIESTIGGNPISGAAYNATQADFSFSENRINLEPFSLESDQIGLGLGGWADLDGPLDLKLALKTTRDGIQIQHVPDRVLDILKDDRGWVNIPLRVPGTLDQPRVTPDTNALIAQAGTGATRLLGGLLESLFSKEKKP